jgi:hypothetical protein
MRPIALMLLAAFSTIAWAADEAPAVDPKLPAVAAAAMKDYQADLAKLKADYDAKVSKRALELGTMLTKVQTDVTKKGDLEGALAVKGVIEKLPFDRLDDLGNKIPAVAADNDTLIAAVKKGTLTEAQWAALKFPEITCDAKGKTDLKITLTKSQKCIVIPNPVDRWQGEPGSPKFGYAGQVDSNGEGWSYYSMIVRSGEDDSNARMLATEPVVAGPGKVYVWLFWNGSPSHVGGIRVKVIPLR